MRVAFAMYVIANLWRLLAQQLDQFFAYDARFAGGLYVAGR